VVKPLEVTIGDDGAIVQTINDAAAAPAGK
jgi:hypothetical protein